MRRLTAGRGADIVIVAASAPGIVTEAITASRPGARIMLFAQTAPDEVFELRGADLCAADRTLLGSYSASLDLQEKSAEIVWSEDFPVEEVRNLTDAKRGCDVVIEAVGSPQTWKGAVDMVRSGGTVNFFGGCPSGSHVPLDTSRVHYSEITLKSSFHHTPKYIRRALEIVAGGEISAEDFVINEAPLTDLLSVFRHMMSHNGHLETAILPWPSRTQRMSRNLWQDEPDRLRSVGD